MPIVNFLRSATAYLDKEGNCFIGAIKLRSSTKLTMIFSFLKYSKIENIKCNGIDYAFEDYFELFIQKKRFVTNFMDRLIGLVKNVLDFAIIKKHLTHNPLTALQFKYDEKLNTTSLDFEHIELLQNHSFITRIQKVVDVFLFMCGTGIDHCNKIRLKSYNWYTENCHFLRSKNGKNRVQRQDN